MRKRIPRVLGKSTPLAVAKPGIRVVRAFGQFFILDSIEKQTLLSQGEFEDLVWKAIVQRYHETIIFNQKNKKNAKSW